jgi:lipid-A-disaccharide synthase
LFLEAGRRVQHESDDEVQLVLARATSIARSALSSRSSADVCVVDDARDLLAHSKVALVKSGTATLEAALAGTPLVTVYRTHPVTYALARRLLRIDRIALPNLIAGRDIVPEVLQREATPERLAELILRLLPTESTERAEMITGLTAIQGALGESGASARVAALAAELLESA